MSLNKTQVLVVDMTCFTFHHFLCLLWHGLIILLFGSFFYLLSRYDTWMMASINLVMVSQSNIFNRDFIIDHKLSMELWSSEFLDQSNTCNLCFLNVAFTVKKCLSHICNDFSFNYANAFVWMRHTLNCHKWTCSGKAKTAPEHFLGMFYITRWNGEDLTAHPFWAWQICCAALERKNDFHLKTALFYSFLQSNFYDCCPLLSFLFPFLS